MNHRILIIGGGIGGLTATIALRRHDAEVIVIERDPNWSVYGVGIIQQSNVVRAMADLGILDDYLDAGFAFDSVDIFLPSGQHVAKIPSPKLVPNRPANVGIGRRALQAVLGNRAKASGAEIRLGVTVETLNDTGDGVDVVFSDGQSDRFDLVIGADGLYSQTREMLFSDAPKPAFTGQAVWRYNLPRTPSLDSLHVYEGRVGLGLVPLSDDLMYMYLTTPEPSNPRYPQDQMASAMRDKLTGMPPAIATLTEQITNNEEVVYKPLEWLFLEGAWHKGRVVLLGDAVHATTPHLGQGAGMAIEDSIVLAEELDRDVPIEDAFVAYRERRFERCGYIVRQSLAICQGQIGEGPLMDAGKATHEMFLATAAPI